MVSRLRRLIPLLSLALCAAVGRSQDAALDSVTLEGYAFEANNAGFLNEVRLQVEDAGTGAVLGRAISNQQGFFAVRLPAGRAVVVHASKDIFEPTHLPLGTAGAVDGKVYLKVALDRAPGYSFEVTLAERRGGRGEADAVTGALIEVYNNTTDSTVLTLPAHPSPYFTMHLDRGNHYTLLIRTPGYFSKRIEAYVNVEGCILCMDGVAEVGPGVSDNLASGNDEGTLLANVELERMDVDTAIQLENIYYGYNSAEITQRAATELDEVAELMGVNPSIMVELGSHTDSRGQADYNRALSQRRAEAAVDYVLARGVDSARIAARGYGEDRLTNVCADDIECDEAEHARNRRTELRVTGFTLDPFSGKPLAELLREERAERLLAEVLGQAAYRAPSTAEDGVTTRADGGDPSAVERVAAVRAGRGLDALRGDLSRREAPDGDPNAPDALAEGGEPPVIPTDRAARAVPQLVRNRALFNAKPLTRATGERFTGYRVLVFQSPTTLADANGELFFKYGTLTEEVLADNTFGYLSGAFDTEHEARRYVGEVQALFPAARLLRFVNGFATDPRE